MLKLVNDSKRTHRVGARRFSAKELAKVEVSIHCDRNPFLECESCGSIWTPILRSGGRMPRGYWKCPRGCNV